MGLVAQTGFGLYWAWVALAFYSDSPVLGQASSSAMVDGIWLYSTLFHFVSLVVCSVAARQIGPLFDSPRTIWLAAGGLSLGMLGFVALSTLVVSADAAAMTVGATAGTDAATVTSLWIPILLNAILVGVSSCILFLIWGKAYTHLGTAQGIGASLLAFMTGLVLYFVFCDFPAEILGAVACVALPLLSAACLHFLTRNGLAAQKASACHEFFESPSESDSRIEDVAVLVAAVFAFAFGGELLRAFSLSLAQDAINTMGAYYLFGGVFGISVLIAYWMQPTGEALPRIISMRAVRIILVVMAGAFASIPLFSNVSVLLGYGIFGAGFWCFRVVSWIYCLLFCRRFGTRASRAFGILDAAFAASVILSDPIIQALLPQIGSDGAGLTIASLAIALILMFTSVFVLYNRQSTTVFNVQETERLHSHVEASCSQPGAFAGNAADTYDAGTNDIITNGASAVPIVAGQPTTAILDAILDTKISAVAQRFGLTEREAQVARLMAQGRTLPYIQEALCISAGTAQTHSRHIYKKMSIHSRGELIDIITSSIAE